MTEPEGSPEPAANRNKVEITLGGTTVVVDSDESLGTVKFAAMDLMQRLVTLAGPRIVTGFAAPPPVIERAEPFPEPAAPPYGSETERAPRSGRADAIGGAGTSPGTSASG